MKQLFLMRGIPGSGKSTLLRKIPAGYIVSSDDIRLIYSPVVNKKNTFDYIINPDNDSAVWDLLHEVVKQRLLKGFTTIVDATHCSAKSISYWKSFCQENKITCTVVEMSTDFNKCKENNLKREPYKVVPEKVLVRMFENMKEEIPSFCKVISDKEFSDMIETIFIKKETNYIPLDYNKFNKIVVIGDVHGCYEPLKCLFEKYPIQEDTKYIFVGDYEDRGIQNKETFEFLLQHRHDSNFLFLKGNHTRHTYNYAIGEHIDGKEFRERTIKQISSLDKRELKKFCLSQADFSYFTFCGQKFIITHAGVPRIPNCFDNETDMVFGIGGYESSEIIDEEFRKNNPDVITIHGHRNLHEVPFDIGLETGYYNLEGQVESGKQLRYVVLEKTEIGELDIQPGYIVNKVFRDINSDKDIIQELEDCRFVKAKELSDGIKGYSFTEECFNDKRWDKLTTKARGLFCRGETTVARSFDKFFNIGEQKSLEEIAEQFVYPVIGYKKENGYLGIVSYDKVTDSLFVSSKNTNTSDYAEYFKDYLISNHSKVNKDKSLYDKLYDMLKERNISLVFEVCDSNVDPHIVKYSQPNIFLLEAFENCLKEISLPFSELQQIATELGVSCKQVYFEIKDKETFKSLINQWEHTATPNIEGFVFEDANHFRVKYKTRWYRFWKHIRNTLQNTVNKFSEDRVLAEFPEFQSEINLIKQNLSETNKCFVKSLINRETFSVILFRDLLEKKK